ncbi:MAG: NAD(P)H-binding protein [Cyclobacteriaceae bacterium]|nr:NAD(P)H-binding protein [Cyclobacteriaceae bacterium]MCH8514713.1 NAD(P)H-binding protein [Cyclobacteriaceae bacterium]
MKKVVIAGATGFIGRFFIEAYRHKYHIIALSRKKVKDNPYPEVEWRQVEMYSITSTMEAVKGADYAIYLVHSMNAATRLNQGSFDDTDLLLADNFARACDYNEVKQIIFMGGILPKEKHPEEMSRHLRSRYEVEQTLGSKRPALTALRAGIVIGPGGSSFNIVKRLVDRLPIMACPKWCDSENQPIGIKDILRIIDYSLGNENLYGRPVEVGIPEVMSYRNMLQRTAQLMGKRRWIFSVPFFSLGFSKLWVGWISNSSSTLVSPLVESLKHQMTVDPSHGLPEEFAFEYETFEESLNYALSENEKELAPLPSFQYEAKEKNTVRSFQRLPNEGKLPAHWIANRYKLWLPTFFGFLITAKETNDDTVGFYLFGINRPMLQLKLINDRSDASRQIFYINGGWLVKRFDYGWLEFRNVLQDRYTITAIHEFVPRLPWVIYMNTQALVHLWVMRQYKKYLYKIVNKRGQQEPVN